MDPTSREQHSEGFQEPMVVNRNDAQDLGIEIMQRKDTNEEHTAGDREAKDPFRTPSQTSLQTWSAKTSTFSSSSKHSSLTLHGDEKAVVGVQAQVADEDSKDFFIEHVADSDDIEHMSPFKRAIYRLCPFIAAASTVAFWAYFALRVKFTRTAENQDGRTFYMAWMFIGVELGIAGPMILFRSWQMLGLNKRQRPKLRLRGPEVPSVDVAITCCGEDCDVVMDTAKAACDVDYPMDRFRVMIFDDGRSSELKEAVEAAARHQLPNLYYRSRPKVKDHHAKAGNLNYALAETKNMPGGAAPFLAALDADMIPEKDWLRALLPHLLRDEKCSMSCPPQLFYNVPSNDPLSQCLDTFVHISEPIKDSMGVAWCTGSGYILRRKAIDEIGGFPIGSLAEDVCCSSMLLGFGWTTAFVHEPLQWGTVPESLTSHLKQRTRWTVGTIQTACKLRFCLWGPLVKDMTFRARFCGFVYTVSALSTIVLVISLLTVPIVLSSGGNLVPFTEYGDLVLLLRVCFVQLALARIEERILYLPSGYRTGQRDQRAMLWMAPYHALSIIQQLWLPKWLGGAKAVFTSTGSQKCELNERDPQRRAPLHRRLKVTLWDCKCYIHLSYILYVVASILYSTWKIFNDERNKTLKALLIEILTHGAWPPMLWVVATVSCWTPIQYAFSPPNMPHREELLDRDPKTGVAHPTEKAKKVKSTQSHWVFEALSTLITLYTFAMFVISFWL